MTSNLAALCFDANDPHRLARFWGDLLGWETAEDAAYLVPTDDTGFGMRFLPTPEPKRGQNQIHFHLTSTSLEDQQRTVDKALALGAEHLDVGQTPEDGHIVLADPEGNEFCIIEPGNKFLGDCGFFAELACDGTQAVGYFWSAALGWPLNWDQDEETSIRSPQGGPKVSWGGPPLNPRTGRIRMRFDIAPADGDQQAEVDRLVTLGAALVDRPDDGGPVVMADPDGNEFRVLAAR